MTTKIYEAETTLKEMKSKKKELEAQIEKERVAKLLDVIAKNDMTIEDATKFIENLASTDSNTTE